MARDDSRRDDRRQQQQQRRPRQDRPQRRPQGEPARNEAAATSPIRKKSPNAALIAVILVAVAAIAILALLFLPGACSRMDGGEDITVTNTEGSLLSEEQLIDRAKERYAGTWVISSVTWQGEEGDSTVIPQQVVVNVDGSCTISQGGKDYNGKWEIDGDSLYVTANADGEEIIKVLSIDDTTLNINSNNGTGTYVRTSKPKIEKSADSE